VRAAGPRRRQVHHRGRLYRQAEIQRIRGDLAAAENAFREATEWGQDAQPGLALLRLAEGDTEAAAGAIRRVVTETTDRLRRAKLLPAYVEIMLATNDISRAREAADELSEIAGVYDTPAQRAAAGCALGSVLLAEGEARPALGALRGAWEQWRAVDAPYEAARARVLIGLACRALGDEDSAALELDAARRVFAELGAAPDLVRVEQYTRKRPRAAAHGLIPREQQVLRLVAAGKTTMRSLPTSSSQKRPWIGT
jgi:tetratricopeptide (TPR) repeat protein